MIDTQKLNHVYDYKCDDHGSFIAQGVHHCYFTVCRDDDGTFTSSRLSKRPSDFTPGYWYDLKTSYWKHRVDGDFRRRSYELKLCSSTAQKKMDSILLQYLFAGEEHPITIAAHGSSTSSKPYRRSTESLREKIRKKLHEGKSSCSVYDEIVEEQGGVLNVKALGKIPRSRQEIADVKRHVRSQSRPKKVPDEMFELVEQCKDESSSKDPFLRRVVLAPEPMCVLALDRQLQDMKLFLTESGNAVIMGVDSTFNLGPFLATIITYHHPLLNDCSSGKSPVIVGPILMHVQKTTDSYAFLGQELARLCPELKNVQWIGTDREKAIFAGLHQCMPNARNILCTKHVRDNIERKLTDIGFGRKIKKAICCDIFGDESGHDLGLITATSVAEFDEKKAGLEKEWNGREKATGIKRKSTFFDYFARYVADDMKSSMIAPVRETAGLSPQSLYYNNDNESINSKIKRMVQRKRTDWPTFVKIMKQMCQIQSRNVDRSVFEEGPYRLKSDVACLGAASEELTSLTTKERAAILRRFHNFEPICILRFKGDELAVSDDVDDDDVIATPADETLPSPSLSVSCNEFNLSSALYGAMWEKAARLLQVTGSIVRAPLSDKSWSVVSKSNARPNFVAKGKGNSLTCDCTGNREKGLCSHVLAVADLLGTLQPMLAAFIRSRKGPKLTNLSLRDMPSHPGDKPGTRHRKRSRTVIANVTRAKQPTLATIDTRSPKDSADFILRLLSGTQIRMCYGCGNMIRLPPNVPNPPHDVVLARKEYRTYKDGEGNRKVTAKKDFVHYHFRSSCVLKKNSTFTKADIRITAEMRQKLSRVHWVHLREEFSVEH